MISKTGGRAFPCDQIVEMDDEGMRHGPGIASGGMTLRDYFAAKALATVPAYGTDDIATWSAEDFASHAYALADAMLKARAT